MNTRQMVWLAGLAAAVIGWAQPSWAQADDGPEGVGGDRRQTMRIHVDVEDANLADVMEQIGRQVGRNILVDPNVQERVTTSLRDIPWREAVDVIARMTRCEVETRPGGILILTQPPKVTIQFTDANVRTVLQLLAAYSGKNIIISPEVRGRVTLDLKEVHWLRALHAIVKTVGDYEVVEETDDLLRVVSRSSIEQQLETVVFPLKYVRPPAFYRAVPPTRLGAGSSAAAVFVGNPPQPGNPEDNFTLFRALASVVDSSGIRGATLEYDLQTNSFVITATRPLILQLQRIIEKIDLEPAQVYAEVKFVSIRDNLLERTGIEFGDEASDRGIFLQGPFFPQNRTFTEFTPGPDGVPTSPAREDVLVGTYAFPFGEGFDRFTKPFFLPGVLDLRGLNMTLNLLERDDRSRVIQSPSLFMLDNTDAVIFVGENVPYAELDVQPDANGNVQQRLQEGRDSPVAVGFSLFIQPHIVPDSDKIDLTVIPRVNSLTGTTSDIPGFERFAFGGLEINLPRTREQALVSQVLLDDTHTAVLGGLRTEAKQEVIKRVPILSSLPIIGPIFTSRQINDQVDNLTILITPTIIRQQRTVNSIFLRATRRLEEDDWVYRKIDAPSEDEYLDEEDALYDAEEGLEDEEGD